MLNKKITMLMSLILLPGFISVYAGNTFICPEPTEIQSTDFTAPSIWIAPPVNHSIPNQVGVGLGGKQAVKLLGVEKTMINHKRGWVCVYQSEGGTAANDYENKIKSVVSNNKFLVRYLNKLNKTFADAQPYLNNYPKDVPLGFIGYQLKRHHSSQE